VQKLKAEECFKDTGVCDDTHKTNRFGMPYFAVHGIDRNNKTFVLAQALISHQDIPSYAWVFHFLKRELRGVEPKTFFSDGDLAIAAAIKEVFPNTKHCLCMWHFKGTHFMPLNNIDIIVSLRSMDHSIINKIPQCIYRFSPSTYSNTTKYICLCPPRLFVLYS